MKPIMMIRADVLDWCVEYDGPQFHAMLCDPPYSLNFMNKKWDNDIAFRPATWAALKEHLLPGAFIFVFGSSRGWHRLAVAIEDAGFVFHPSLMVWGWVNGAGFPKATRIDTQIDRRKDWKVLRLFQDKVKDARMALGISQSEAARRAGIIAPDKSLGGGGFMWFETGMRIPTHVQYQDLKVALQMDDSCDLAFEAAEREVIGQATRKGKPPQPMWGENDGQEWDITAPATDLACTWEGHRYGRQALKPAVEMIICAQKPYEGRPVDSIVETGAGSLFIDGGRVSGVTRDPRKADGSLGGHSFHGYEFDGRPKEWDRNQGRWPPNFCLLHSPDCQRAGTKRVKGSHSMGKCQGKEYPNRDRSGDLFPEMGKRAGHHHVEPDGKETVAAWHCAESCAARRIGEQSGDTSRAQVRHTKYSKPLVRGETDFKRGMSKTFLNDYGDKGTAARFFPQFGWAAEIAERLANSDQVQYCSKASRKERDAGLDNVESIEQKLHIGQLGKQVGEIWIDRKDGRGKVSVNHSNRNSPRRCSHPCVKPIALCRWLATLLLPPPEYAPRRILVPFAGVASEMIAAGQAGWEEIIGIEREAEYCQIGEARLVHWLRQPRLKGMEL